MRRFQTDSKKQENHELIVATASELFREHGFDGVAVAELMEKAGLTHGGFYNHFRSKDELVAEAIVQGFREIVQRYGGCDALAVVDLYLSREHRDGRALGCPAAALSGDAARQPDETRAVFAGGIEKFVEVLGDDIAPQDEREQEARAEAISVLAQAVGAIVLSRACPDNSPLADEILDVCRASCLSTIKRAARK